MALAFLKVRANCVRNYASFLLLFAAGLSTNAAMTAHCAADDSDGEAETAGQDALPKGALARFGDGRFQTGYEGVIAYSTDGRHLISSGYSGIDYIDARSGRRVRRIPLNYAQRFAVDPKGEWVATTDLYPDSTTAVVIDGANEKLRHFLKGHEQQVVDLAASPDGEYLATTSQDYTVRIWRPRTGEQVHVLRGHNSDIAGAKFCGSETLVTADRQGKVLRWDVKSGKLLGKRIIDTERQRVDILPGGRHVAVAGKNAVQICDVESGAVEIEIPFNDAWAFSPDGKLAIVGTQVWDVGSRSHVATLAGTPSQYSPYNAVSPDGKTLACASFGGSSSNLIRRFDLGTGKELTTDAVHLNAVNTLVFSADSKWLWSASSNSRSLSPVSAVWNVEKRSLAFKPEIAGKVSAFEFSPDGTKFLAREESTVWEWTLADGTRSHKKVSSPSIPPGHIRVAGRIVGADSAGRLMTFESESSAVEVFSDEHWGPVTALVGSRHGGVFAAGSADRTISVWKAENLEKLATLSGPRDRISQISLSDDGRVLVVATASPRSGFDPVGDVFVWDTSTGKLLRRWADHPWASAAAVSPDGRLVAIAEEKFTLWSVETGERLVEFEDERSHSYKLAFSPNGELLATASANGTIVLWDVRQLRK